MCAKANRLARSLSPYLLQHQYNPVDWYPWGQEAFEKARQDDKPIFLSIGYSACHWCHVMEHESFENEEIARLLNEHFVSVKVDREEHPDIDKIYMSAVQAMTGHGGWPMSVFLTPSLHPFIAGTYFPPESRHGMPGFKAILEEIAKAWESHRQELVESSDKVFQFLKEEERIQSSLKGHLSPDLLKRLVEDCESDFDPKWGGFGRAPKFPQTGPLSALLRCYLHDHRALTLHLLTKTLDQMALGGIYDQIGGGFHRYSVDERWLVPHFEKMLYDNALLSRLYLETYQVTKDPFYLDVATQTLDYLMREMQHPQGGFYSAEDADSEGEEGKYYVWIQEEIYEVLGQAEGELFCRYYGVTPEGNFEGASILNQVIPIQEASQEDKSILFHAREKLRKHRDQRIHPHLDDKVLVDWNGLAITSFAKGYAITQNQLYLEAAEKASQFILNHLMIDGHLMHLWRGTAGSVYGFLDDYANMINAWIDLYECAFDDQWLFRAQDLAQEMIKLFWDPQGKGFFSTSQKHKELLVRKKPFSDEMTPSGNAQAALALLRLASYFRADVYQSQVQDILTAHAKAMEQASRWYGYMLCVLDAYLSSMQEIVVAGKEDQPETQILLQCINSEFLPHLVLGLKTGKDSTIPFLQEKEFIEGKSLAYLCQGRQCYPPLSDPKQLRKELEKR